MGGLKTKLGLLGLVVVCLGLVAPASAVPTVLADNGCTVTVDPQSQLGLYNWTVQGIGYNLFQEWFWVGTAAGGQASLDTLPFVVNSATASTLDLTFTGVGYTVRLATSLIGGGAGPSPSSDIAQTIVVTNNTGAALRFYQYADFDLLGIPGGDSVVVTNANRVDQTKLGSAVTLSETILGPAPNLWEASTFPATLAGLNGAATYNLNGVLAAGPGDATWAAEWIVEPGTLIISKDMRLVVPEPVTMFSAFMAISGLGLYIRKRTKANA